MTFNYMTHMHCSYIVCSFVLYILLSKMRGHGSAVVKHWPHTSEVSGSNPRPFVKKLVVPYRWLAVDSSEP